MNPEDEQVPRLEDANFRATDGSIVSVQVPAFPTYPALVKTRDGRYFVADNPVIGYGTSGLNYHEVSVYEAVSA